MKNTRFFAIVATLCVVGTSVLLVGCGQSTGSTTGSDDAQKQFLAERGSGTPGVVSDTIGLDGQGGTGTRPPGVFGEIDKIEGGKIYVKNPMSGETTTVQLADGAKVQKPVEIKSSEIKVGDTISAFGPRNGDVVDAEMVRVGQDGMDGMALGGPRIFGGGPGGLGGPGDFGQIEVPLGTPGITGTPGDQVIRGGPGGPGGPGGMIMQGNPVLGTVEKIDGDNITVKPGEGNSVTVYITSTTRLLKQAEVALSDLQVGNTVAASGTQNGDVFEATRLQVVEAVRFERP